MTMSTRPEFTITIDPAIRVGRAPTFYMLARWHGTDDLSAIEREIAAALGITDVDDYGGGLCFNRYGDARLVAQALAARLAQPIGVVDSAREAIRYIAQNPRSAIAEDGK